MKRIYGVLMALLLLAIPLLIADIGSAELMMDIDAVVWAQDAGPPLMIVGSDTMQTILSGISTEAMSINDPAIVRSDNLGVRSTEETRVDTQKPTTSLSDGTADGRMVPAWRVGEARAG